MNRPGLHIFVLIDALGWEFLQRRAFLTDLLPHRFPLRTILGFSSGAIPAMLTGLLPFQNGHWNLYYYDPNTSPFRWLRYFSFLPERLMDNRVTRKALQQTGRRLLGMGPGFDCCVSPRLLPWFNWIEKRNIYERGGIPGSQSIFDTLAENGIPYRAYSYHHSSDQQILDQALREVGERRANFFFLYLSEMDRLLHDHPQGAAELDRRLSWYAQRLTTLFERARAIEPEFSFTVVSDHGMTPVVRHCDLATDIESLGFRMPNDYLAVYDSTMARFWFFSDQARCALGAHLQQAACGRVLTDAELRELGIFFPDRRYGETILLLHPGWMIARSNFNGPRWMPAGMHGYHPDDPHSDAVFLSNRQPSAPVRTISDIHRCMKEVAA